MNVVHIAATTAGGAGIGMLRYHSALQLAGVDSRIILPEAACAEAKLPPKEKSAFTWKPEPWWQRGLARAHLPGRSLAVQFQERLSRIQTRHPQSRLELFSLPFSGFRPEIHPWLREADVVVLHWVAGVVDWPRFFAANEKPLAIVLHDQNPYLGGFHYRWDADRNPAYASLETDVRALKAETLRGQRLAVLANSDWNANEARASGFFAPEVTIVTAPYPLDRDHYQPADRVAARAAHGSAAGRFVVGFACEDLNNDRKGFADLLAALRRLPAADLAEMTLLSFGRPPTADVTAEMPLPWKHLGRLDGDAEKAAAYRAMNIFVAPSRAEAFGLTALEAQACGTPVVAAPIEGLREAVALNPVAEGPDETRVERLVAGILALRGDTGRHQAAAAAGLELVHSRHDPRHLGQQWAESLQTLSAA